MSYYENYYPEINEVVYVIVSAISENGVYCTLLEYEHKEGFLADTEMDKKIYYVKKKYFAIGKKMPMMVIDIDFNRDQIDLSHKQIKDDDRDKYIKYFDYMTKMYRLSMEFSKFSNINLTEILPLTMWKFAPKTNLIQSKETFKQILENPHDYLSETKKLYSDQTDQYLESMQSRISNTKMVVAHPFKLIINSGNYVNEINSIFDIKFENSDVIKIEYKNAPIYHIVIEGSNEEKCNQIFKEWYKIISEKIINKDIFFELIDDKVFVKDSEISIRYLQ